MGNKIRSTKEHKRNIIIGHFDRILGIKNWEKYADHEAFKTTTAQKSRRRREHKIPLSSSGHLQGESCHTIPTITAPSSPSSIVRNSWACVSDQLLTYSSLWCTSFSRYLKLVKTTHIFRKGRIEYTR